MAEVIRYGAGGVPYKGNVGPASTEEVVAPPVKEKEPELEMKFEEDDTPLTDEQVAKKIEGKK